MSIRKRNFNINGAIRLIIYDPEKDMLSTVLRRIGLTGTKVGCKAGQCGICSVLIDGKVVRSCMKKMDSITESMQILTIEGIGTPNQLHPLQQAFITYGGVQCGFCSPGFIVSSYALLQENNNPTREEVRDWFARHRNICRCTGYKPLVDCVMAAAKVMRGEATMEDITYQFPKDGSVYGTSVPRPAALAKVTGTCDFGDDIGMKMPEVLHLAVVLSGVSNAKILSLDTSEAEKMPGVEKVITAKDVKGNNRIMMPLGNVRSQCDGFDRSIIASDRIYRYGDIVAVVAARTREEAWAAAKKVTMELERLPEYMNILDSCAEDAIQLHPEHPNIYLEQPLFKGEDTREVIKNSKYVAEGSFHSTRQPHLILEPDTGQAYIDDDGVLTIHCKSLALPMPIFTASAGMGWPKEKIRIIENPTGSSFGYTISPSMPALLGVCTIAAGKPVTLTLSFEEHQHITGKRAPSYTNARIACDENGKLTAIEYEIAYDKGAYSETAGFVVQKGVRFMGAPYTIPNAMGLSKAVMSNHACSTSYKGFGSPQCTTASEQLIDMIAEKAGIDPFEFRYINVYKDGDLTINGHTLSVYPMTEILDKMRPCYEAAVKRAKEEDTPEVRRGVGVVCGTYNVTSGPNDHSEVEIGINADGTFTSYNTWEDQGQGADAGTLVHTCEALRPLGVKLEQIRLCMNDTGEAPLTGAAAGSRSHYMAGNAIIDAANKLMNAMRKDDGTYRTYEEMAAAGIPTKYKGISDTTSFTKNIDPNTSQTDVTPTAEYTYGAFLSEVAVDVKTGVTKVLSMRCVADVGTVGHPVNVEGQAFGGMFHGIGFALTEDYDDIKKHATLVGAGFPDIKMIPDDMSVEFVVSERPTGPHGSSGCAELFQTSPHIAVINAIYNACGVRIHELPARPEKILAGLAAKSRGEDFAPKRYFLGADFYEKMDHFKANPFQK